MVKNLSTQTRLSEQTVQDDARGSDRYDDIFEVLSATRRRNVLRYLREEGGPVSFEELASEIASIEREIDHAALGQEKWEDVTVALAHVHLPLMDGADVLEYDEQAETIDVDDRSALAWRQLEAMERDL